MRPESTIHTANLHRGNRRGAALLLVLWIIGLLGIIVVSFSWDAHLEKQVVQFARKRMRADALAMSGYEQAKMLINHASELPDTDDEDAEENDKWYKLSKDLKNGHSLKEVFSCVNGKFEVGENADAEGLFRIDIVPEGGGEELGRNVNTLKDEDWERIFSNVLGLPEEYWPELIDSFNDWRDEDDNPSENGAETDDYYNTLEPKYTAKNGPLDTVEELLRIKGFSKAILEGGPLNPDDPESIVISNGVKKVLSTIGDGKVNVNAVPDNSDGLLLLMTLPGIDEVSAKAIFEERNNPSSGTLNDDEDTGFKSIDDFMARVGSWLDDNSITEYITVGMRGAPTGNFSISSVGQVDRVTRRVKAVVYFDGGKEAERKFKVLRWYEEP